MIKRQDPISLANSLMESRSNPHHINPISERFQKLLSEIIEYLLSSDKWQPIETAPKDYSRIIGFGRYNNISITYYNEFIGWICEEEVTTDYDGATHGTWSPTHWLPLPPKPNTD